MGEFPVYLFKTAGSGLIVCVKRKDVFLELVKKADILIEKYRPGTMEKLGIGYEELKKVNPKLVYYTISAICPDSSERIKTQKIITAGNNFGSGSSRETSPFSLKYLETSG